MRALTVSELNQTLIEKGFSSSYSNYIPENKWGADYFLIHEREISSYLLLMKSDTSTSIARYATTIASYSKLKASEKKEVAEFLLSLK